MPDNITRPTDASVDEFLDSVTERRRHEARALIDMMRDISGEQPVLWGSSIIGFGTEHYRYDTGREGDQPGIGFSPRKASITIYFSEGFEHYGDELSRLGKHRASVSCLYLNKLADVDLDVLRSMLEASWHKQHEPLAKPTTVDEYIAQVPDAAREKFDDLRALVRGQLPEAEETLSCGIVGYRTGKGRARVYISGFKDHVAIYPVPSDESLREELRAHIHGKGSIWFALDEPLPTGLIRRTVAALVEGR